MGLGTYSGASRTPPPSYAAPPASSRRTAHGDFAQYHRRFGHTDAELNCLCGYAKTPEHLVFCEIPSASSMPGRPSRNALLVALKKDGGT
ncbi:hypothetical protein DID88_004206 [Monilinia fructigena]|uniref:Uncharacterized protein n=1 Tax=Monilinia fructigena TaxID=38457 RepID=A0A395ITD9_9HELO|nr:hypothetical protein DID88_004206 [Monilinia fructigena]